MPLPRKVLVNSERTLYYHCITRCVRRAFLCGHDSVTGRNFNHRKRWVVERLRYLGGVFAIKVCAYAVMSNHLHLVVRLQPEQVERWTDGQVLRRWRKLFPLSATQWRLLPLEERQRRLVEWRARLGDLSWFMRCLNEAIARRANREDGCTGRFWEGRFRTQALMDEGAVLTCMSYVDLNPIRAGLARSVRAQRFTSVRERLRHAERGRACRWLAPLQGEQVRQGGAAVEITLNDYVALLQATARALLDEKREMGGRTRELLKRFGLQERGFLWAVRCFSRTFFTMAGEVHRIRVEAAQRGCRKCMGAGAARRLYLSGEEIAAGFAQQAA